MSDPVNINHANTFSVDTQPVCHWTPYSHRSTGNSLQIQKTVVVDLKLARETAEMVRKGSWQDNTQRSLMLLDRKAKPWKPKKGGQCYPKDSNANPNEHEINIIISKNNSFTNLRSQLNLATRGGYFYFQKRISSNSCCQHLKSSLPFYNIKLNIKDSDTGEITKLLIVVGQSSHSTNKVKLSAYEDGLPRPIYIGSNHTDLSNKIIEHLLNKRADFHSAPALRNLTISYVFVFIFVLRPDLIYDLMDFLPMQFLMWAVNF